MRLLGLSAVVRGILSVFGTTTTTRRSTSGVSTPTSPGQAGPEATIEVPASMLQRSSIVFDPRIDAEPDPGEVVWTWVPYEENDGRGKDRPVVIVARDTARSILALQLTSKPHDDDARHFVYVGPGPWDSQGRPSWARLDRVFRVYESGMRRDADSVTRKQFTAVSSALKIVLKQL